jgi:hypothetical protein
MSMFFNGEVESTHIMEKPVDDGTCTWWSAKESPKTKEGSRVTNCGLRGTRIGRSPMTCRSRHQICGGLQSGCRDINQIKSSTNWKTGIRPSFNEESSNTANTSIHVIISNYKRSLNDKETHPTRIWRGKKPTMTPSFIAPRRKNARPASGVDVKRATA